MRDLRCVKKRTRKKLVIRRQVKKLDLDKESYLGWNAFVDLVASENYEDLSEIQKIAHLIFWYDAEVNNGGHLQYFLNLAGRRAPETLTALSQVGLDCQQIILADAVDLISKEPLPKINSVEEYVAEALEGKFNELDSRYSACPKETMDFLEEYLEQNFNEFIELT